MCKLKVTKFQVFCLKSKLIYILSNHQQTYSRNFGQVCKPQVLSSNELHKLVKPRVNFIATTLGESPAQWPHCPAQQASSQGGGGGDQHPFSKREGFAYQGPATLSEISVVAAVAAPLSATATRAAFLCPTILVMGLSLSRVWQFWAWSELRAALVMCWAKFLCTTHQNENHCAYWTRMKSAGITS